MTLDELYLAQNNDDSYREEFYTTLLDYGRSLLMKWYRGRWQQYEDAIQEVIISLIDPIKAKPKNKAKFTTWFYKALKNSCTQLVFDESRQHSIEQMPERMQAVYRPKNFDEVIHTLDLQQRMKVLTELEKTIVAKIIAGFSQIEIAKMLHIDAKHVSRLYQNSIEKLRGG